MPFFSADGRWVGFYRNDTREWVRVAATGGQPTRMERTTLAPRGVAWAPDGSIVFGVNTPDAGLQSLPAGGGEIQTLTRPDQSSGERFHAWPSLLPNGAVLFTVWTGNPETSQVHVYDPRAGTRKNVVRRGIGGQYVSTGHIVYAAGSTLHAARFDVDRLDVRGSPVPVLEGVHTSSTSGSATFAVSTNGTLVYLPTKRIAEQARSLLWVDRAGREEVISTPRHNFWLPRLSPDGTKIAIDARDPAGTDIWIWHVGRRLLTRLTTDPLSDISPISLRHPRWRLG